MSTCKPTRDPLAHQVAKTRVVLWVCALVVLAAISVRWWPMAAEATSLDSMTKKKDAPPDAGEAGPQGHSPRLDLAAFDRAMWLVSAAPEVPKTASDKPAPPPPPLTLQLLGLVNENGTTKAILYDSATDRVRVVAVGDSIGELQEMLTTLLESLIEAREEMDDGDGNGALADIAREMVDEADGLERVESFADAELLTTNAGLIIRCRDGSEFQLTVVQSR